MGDRSGIEWTDATWNPIVGCSVVSPGCTNCYAMKRAARIEAMREGSRRKMLTPDTPTPPGGRYAGLTQDSNGGPVWTGQVALAPDDTLTIPLRWQRPRRIFVNSMGDLFHESVPDEWIDRVFAVMALSPRHTFQVLTKRSARMRDYLGAMTVDRVELAMDDLSLTDNQLHEIVKVLLPLPNVHLGVSAEDQPRANERIPDLLATPAAVRFVSYEPALGPVNFRRLRIAPDHHTMVDALYGYTLESGARTRLDWIICGGESGRSARPMHPDWARSARDQCAAAQVPFFFRSCSL